MPAQTGENGAVRVSPVDQRGRPISPVVLSAAEEISRRAVYHAERLLVDPAVAANLLEEAAATVSRALTRNSHDRPIRDLESYLFRAFLRRLNRTKKRQSLLSDAADLDASLSRVSWDPRKTLEMKIFVDELLLQCDPTVRDMLCRRLSGSSWKEVGRAYRISRHAAESKFSQALQKIRRKLRSKRTGEVNRWVQ
jgi:DNA-directed RNA polymerase specialized sigma24 family protein